MQHLFVALWGCRYLRGPAGLPSSVCAVLFSRVSLVLLTSSHFCFYLSTGFFLFCPNIIIQFNYHFRKQVKVTGPLKSETRLHAFFILERTAKVFYNSFYIFIVSNWVWVNSEDSLVKISNKAYGWTTQFSLFILCQADFTAICKPFGQNKSNWCPLLCNKNINSFTLVWTLFWKEQSSLWQKRDWNFLFH